MGSRPSNKENRLNEREKFGRIALENGVFETKLTNKFARRKYFVKHDPRIIKAVIPGVITEIKVFAGKPVRQGDTLAVLEAMKMLNRILAPQDGIIKTIHVKTGEKVSKGQILIEIE